MDGKTLTVEIPNRIFYQWIEQNYAEQLRQALDTVLGNDARLRYSLPNVEKHPENRVDPGNRPVRFSSQLNASYTFENLVEGKSNQLAVSAARTIAARPGKTAFNPILIYGGVGLGKTHLAQAIGNAVVQSDPSMKVLYVPSEKFIQQYVDSFRQDKRNDFINFYQSVDVLIVDDVQFFSGKAGSQEVFFHIFNHLHQSGRQIILTADKSPVDMRDMEERLLSRFKWGLQAELTTPDYEHRLRILEAKLRRDNIQIAQDVVSYIARMVNTNVRELEGVVNSLLAQAVLVHLGDHDGPGGGFGGTVYPLLEEGDHPRLHKDGRLPGNERGHLFARIQEPQTRHRSGSAGGDVFCQVAHQKLFLAAHRSAYRRARPFHRTPLVQGRSQSDGYRPQVPLDGGRDP